MGIPATNKKVSWADSDWWRVADGKLAEHWDNIEWHRWCSNCGQREWMPARLLPLHAFY